MRTWDVMEWKNMPEVTHGIALNCPVCGTDAMLEVGEFPGGLVIAAIGLGLIFEPAGYRPPENSMPGVIRCRHCRKIFES